MAEPTLRSRHELEQAIHKIDMTLNFGDAHLELLSDGRMDAMIKFLKEQFFPDEIISKSIGDKMDSEAQEYWRKVLSDHLSLILVNNATDKIIACRCMVIKKDKKTDLSEIKHEKIKTVIKFLSHRNSEMDVFKRFNVDTCVEFFILGTHRDYRKQGIATKIFQAALLFCKELGLHTVCIKGEGASNYSQRIYENNGFETLHTFRYDAYKVNGDIVFKNTGEHENVKVYVKLY